jgi:hypothetical protein
MNAMAMAMVKAKLITEQHVKRVNEEQEKAAKREQERKANVLKVEKALSTMGWIRAEIEQHLRDYPESIHPDQLEEWANMVSKEKDIKGQHRVATRCWDIYLNRHRQHIQQSAIS